MRSRIRVFQVDAFTSQRFSGNPAGVVLDADALSTDDMQALARELNNGDSAFVLRADADDHDLRVRFFTTRREAAFVGHATVAAHAVLASLGLSPRPRQKQRNGIVQVDTIVGAAPPRIAVHLPVPAMRRSLAQRELLEVLAALGLAPTQLDPSCPPIIAGDSSTRLLLGLEHGASLAQLQPDPVALSRLSEQLDVPGYFLFSRRTALADVLLESRMFCPALGIAEDPVSGNAHALLGAYLWQQGLLGPVGEAAAGSGAIEFSGAQGHHMGRPGRVGVALNLEGGRLDSISIIGEAVVVFETTLEF
ncbi:MAG TPA: PhzF family phenazine biosynthesis isomerase [Steroidobacteraceae bacterium]|jgi:PhzF family phenazine biosynthesis protein